jgi:hypothetical protein
MSKPTLGTAHIEFRDNGDRASRFVVKYMPAGALTIGEQHFWTHEDAKEFCRDRGLRVIREG